jgi:hypothetical protein
MVDYSGWIPACFTIIATFSCSARVKTANSSELLATGSAPSCVSRSRIRQHLLAPGFLHLLRELPADDVGAAARRVGHDDAHRLGRKLGLRRAGGAERKEHDELPHGRFLRGRRP